MSKKIELLHKSFSLFSGLVLVLQSFLPGIYVLANNSAVFAQEETSTVEQTPTVVPTLSPSTSASGDEQLTAVVLAETSATSVQSLGLDPADVSSSATIISDKADYAPTDAALITGTGFTPNTQYTIMITSDNLNVSEQVTTGENGGFIYTYQLDGTYRPLYNVEIKDSAGTVMATTSFTDAPPPSGPAGTDFAQCSNKNPTLGNCVWIGSIVQSSNSRYFEGMTVPQRLLFRNTQIADGIHHITFTYQYTKAGIHAYDFLTTVDPKTPTVQGNTPPETLNPCTDLGGADTTACNTLNPSMSTPTALITVPSDPFDSKDSTPGTGTGSSQATKETNYETANGGAGSRKITVYAPTASAFSSPSITLTHSPATADSDTGDTDVTVDISFTSSGCSTGSGCNYLLYFGGHLALSGANNYTGSNWGPGVGSSQISGGPYHIKSVKFDGSGGSLDNQIKGADILVPPGSISLDKATDPSGDPTSFDFSTTNLPAPTTPSLTDASAPQVWSSLANGTTYTITETVPGGWSLTGRSCTGNTTSTITNITNGVSILLNAGDNIACTFANTLQQGNLIVKKHVVNDSGGTTLAPAFNLHVKSAGSDVGNSPAAGSESGTSYTLNQGTYVVSEDAPPSGYTDTTTDSTNGDCDGSGNVTVVAGQTKTCIITNDDQPATLTVNKVLIGPIFLSHDPGHFDLLVDGSVAGTGGNIQDVNPGASNTEVDGTTGSLTLNGGSHTISEQGTPDSNTDLSKYQHEVRCNDENGDPIIINPDADPIFQYTSDVPLNLDLANGADVTCTIQNFPFGTAQGTGQLIVIKHTVGGDGIFNYSGTTTVPGTDVPPYNELTPFAISNVTTTNGTSGIDLGDGNEISSDSTTIGAFPGFPADVTLTEDGPPEGWVFSNLSCSAQTIGGDPGQSSFTYDGQTVHITFVDEENVTCIYTNTKKGHIVIVKNAIPNNDQDFTFNNDFGNGNPATFLLDDDSNTTLPNQRDFEVLSGTYSVSEDPVSGWQSPESTSCTDGSSVSAIVVSAGETVTCTFTNEKLAKIILVKNTIGGDGPFDFDATGDGLPEDIDLTTSGGTNSQTFENLDPDNTYTISESVPDGWDLTSLECSGTNSPSSITPNAGEVITCTFTNTKQPKLTVTKVVINDNGGTRVVSDFPLAVDGNPVTSGDQNTSTIGAHVVSETGSSDYDATISGDCDVQGNVNLAAGDEKECVITNDDKAPSLTLVKVVNNGNGGNAVESDWTLTADGPTGFSGVGPSVSNGTSFDVGEYTLSESGPTGYSASAWVCQGGTQDGDQVTLGLGQSATCTITNTDQPAKIILNKVVNNNFGGNAGPDEFGISVGGTGVGSGSTTEVNSNSPIAIDEAGLSGYQFVSLTGEGCPAQLGGTVSLNEGQEISCTITNEDIAPTITLVKHVTNDNGGNAGPDDFNLTIGGSPTLSGVTVPVDANIPIALDEAGLSGYSFVSVTGDPKCPQVLGGTVTLDEGENVVCTITNDDLQANLIIIKHVINDDGDVAAASDFTMHLTGDNLSNNDFLGSESGVTVSLDAGSYSADEVSSAGYVKTLSTDCSGTIAVGETITCTITNNDTPHATRTLGFWQTHTNYTTAVFGANNWTIGTHTISSPATLFSAFYASIPKKSTRVNRSALDQARMQMLQQWVAAKLNCQAFTCNAATQTLLASAATAWTSGPASLILSYASQLDTYNNSNDALSISGQGKATPKDSQSSAATQISYWDSLP